MIMPPPKPAARGPTALNENCPPSVVVSKSSVRLMLPARDDCVLARGRPMHSCAARLLALVSTVAASAYKNFWRMGFIPRKIVRGGDGHSTLKYIPCLLPCGGLLNSSGRQHRRAEARKEVSLPR